MLLTFDWLSGDAPLSGRFASAVNRSKLDPDTEAQDAGSPGGTDAFAFRFGGADPAPAEPEADAPTFSRADAGPARRDAPEAEAEPVALALSFDKIAAPEAPDASAFAAASWGGGGFGGGGRFFWRGPREITIEHDGMTRSFIVDVPASYDPNDASASYSAVMVFHGGLSNGYAMLGTGFSQAGDGGDFIAIYPSAVNGLWNDGRDTSDTGYDDIGFVQAVLDEVVANWKVDADSVFATGVSSGGMFVQRLATEMPDSFQGYGVVAANLPEPLQGQALSDTDEPFVFFHGTADAYMPFDGGDIPGRNVAEGAGGTVLSAEGTAEYWADLNDTTMGEYSQMPDIADDGMTTSVRVSQDGSVAQYVIHGGTHTWPGVDASWSTSGLSTQDINATDIMVDFFTDYGL